MSKPESNMVVMRWAESFRSPTPLEILRQNMKENIKQNRHDKNIRNYFQERKSIKLKSTQIRQVSVKSTITPQTEQ